MIAGPEDVVNPPNPTVSEAAFLLRRSPLAVRHLADLGILERVPCPTGWRVSGASVLRLLRTMPHAKHLIATPDPPAPDNGDDVDVDGLTVDDLTDDGVVTTATPTPTAVEHHLLLCRPCRDRPNLRLPDDDHLGAWRVDLSNVIVMLSDAAVRCVRSNAADIPPPLPRRRPPDHPARAHRGTVTHRHHRSLPRGMGVGCVRRDTRGDGRRR